MSEIQQGRTPLPEVEAAAALFREMEKGQFDLLDTAARRIIELDTGLLGLLFALTAFGKDFPPPYLRGNAAAKALALAALAALVCATLSALVALQPRGYEYNRYSPDQMGTVLRAILRHKSRAVRVAGALFFAGCLALAGLVAAILLPA